MKKLESQGSRVIPQPVKGARPAAKYETKMSNHGPLASRVEKMKAANRATNPRNSSA